MTKKVILGEWSLDEAKTIRQISIRIKSILSKKFDVIITYLDNSPKSKTPPKQRLHTQSLRTEFDTFIIKFQNLGLKNSLAQYNPTTKTMVLDCPLTVEYAMKHIDNFLANPSMMEYVYSDDEARQRFLDNFSVVKNFAANFKNSNEYLTSIAHELIHVKQKKEGRAKDGILTRAIGNADNTQNENEALLKAFEQQVLQRPEIWIYEYGNNPRSLRDFILMARQRGDKSLFQNLDPRNFTKKMAGIYTRAIEILKQDD